MSQKIIPPQTQPQCKQSDSATSRFDLTIAYRLLIGAYIRSTGKMKQIDVQTTEQMKQTKQS